MQEKQFSWKEYLGEHARDNNICGYLLMSVFLASLTVLLANRGYLNWLDTVSLQIATPQAQDFNRPVKTYSKTAPVVVTLSDQLYENHFAQSSPLNRSKLHKLIAPILKQKPRLLAIDLDLSPGPKEPDDIPLYDLLKLTALNGTTKIVLITPVPVGTPALIDAKHKWMQEMCKAEVKFALPYLHSTQGVVLRTDYKTQTLANVAYRLNQNEERPPASDEASTTDPSGNICAKIGSDSQETMFLHNLYFANEYDAPAAGYRKHPINFKFFTQIELASIDKPSDFDVRERTVFLGGDYGVTDKFMTPIGELSGVALHAASYFTRHKPVEESHLTSYLFEIALGVIIGAIFAVIWTHYNNTRNPNYAVLILLGYFFLLAGLLVAALYYAGFKLRDNFWIHPAPMIVGMAIHSLLERCEGNPENSNSTGSIKTRCKNFNNLRERWLPSTIFISVVLSAWAVLMLSDH